MVIKKEYIVKMFALGDWITVSYETLRKGSCFSLYKPDGSMMLDDFNKNCWIACSNVYFENNEDNKGNEINIDVEEKYV